VGRLSSAGQAFKEIHGGEFGFRIFRAAIVTVQIRSLKIFDHADARRFEQRKKTERSGGIRAALRSNIAADKNVRAPHLNGTLNHTPCGILRLTLSWRVKNIDPYE
jgi:hypothetical protein